MAKLNSFKIVRMPTTTRLFHLESQTILRETLQTLLVNDGFTSYMGANLNADSLKMLQLQPVDVVLLGSNTNDSGTALMSMMDMCRYIKEHFPSIKIIVHSAYAAKEHLVRLIKAGVDAIVNKSHGYKELKYAIDEAANGRRYICEDDSIVFSDPKSFLRGQKPMLKPDGNMFSEREIEVLTLVARGYSTFEIAQSLYISPKTVETHRKNLVVKSATKNTAEMISYSYRHGLI